MTPLYSRVFYSKWFGLIIVVTALVVAGFIALGYRKWPNVHEGCTPYSCDWIINNIGSGCNDSGQCTYYWLAVVNGYVSSWEWGQRTGEGEGITSTNTTTFVYPNGTVCYKPIACTVSTAAANWVEGSYCFPLLECDNQTRFDGRLAFVLLTSAGLALCSFTAFGCWCKKQNLHSRYQYAIIQ